METGLRDPARGTRDPGGRGLEAPGPFSVAPFAEALCDALAGNGRRLPAIMRPPAGPTGAGNSHVPRGRARVMLGSPAS